jgi:hypothetical protein
MPMSVCQSLSPSNRQFVSWSVNHSVNRSAWRGCLAPQQHELNLFCRTCFQWKYVLGWNLNILALWSMFAAECDNCAPCLQLSVTIVLHVCSWVWQPGSIFAAKCNSLVPCVTILFHVCSWVWQLCSIFASECDNPVPCLHLSITILFHICSWVWQSCSMFAAECDNPVPCLQLSVTMLFHLCSWVWQFCSIFA